MKTSNKLLIASAAFLVAVWVGGLFVLRSNVYTLLEKAALENKYKLILVGSFEGLDFSGGWTVAIRQGKEYKAELMTEEHSGAKPTVKNIKGTLYFEAGTTGKNAAKGKVYAKITVPSLKQINSTGDTKIHMKNFESDSINVVLNNGDAFIGNDNHFRKVSIKTSGDVSFELTEDPDK